MLTMNDNTVSGKALNVVFPGDYRFWELLNEVVQEEPSASLDQIRLGYYASIGIRKGQPFAPDERMKKILTPPWATPLPVRSCSTLGRRKPISFRTALGSWVPGRPRRRSLSPRLR
jgi:hypothetical protein